MLETPERAPLPEMRDLPQRKLKFKLACKLVRCQYSSLFSSHTQTTFAARRIMVFILSSLNFALNSDLWRVRWLCSKRSLPFLAFAAHGFRMRFNHVSASQPIFSLRYLKSVYQIPKSQGGLVPMARGLWRVIGDLHPISLVNWFTILFEDRSDTAVLGKHSCPNNWQGVSAGARGLATAISTERVYFNGLNSASFRYGTYRIICKPSVRIAATYVSMPESSYT